MRNYLLATIFWLILITICNNPVAGQTDEDSLAHRFKVYTYNGETFMIGDIEGIDILAKKPNRRQIQRGKERLAKFTRLRWNVHKVYPYAVKVSDILSEIDAEMAALPDSTSRREYVKQKENSLFGSYEDDLRKMTRTQGKVLVKLVHRETGRSTFDLIRDNKSGASAVFWQSIGLLFGINLKSQFDTEEDEMIEEIVEELDNGGYNIAYRQYNYRLQ
ncbi:MAG: DUF4294 domain-containing protein [Bacteroidia bacterium]